MSANPWRLTAAIIALVAFASAHAGAQEADPTIAAAGHGDTFEATVRYLPAAPGETIPMRLYLAEWATNAPVDAAAITLEVSGPGLNASVTPAPLEAPGQYAFELSLPAHGAYSVLAEVDHAGQFDLFPIDGLTLPEAAAPAGATIAARAYPPQQLALAAGLGLAVLLVAYFLGHWQGRRNTRGAIS